MARAKGITRLADGRYQGRFTYTDERGHLRRKAVYGRTIAEVEGHLADARSDLNKGQLPPEDERLTLGVYLRHWLEYSARPTVRPGTFRGYESKLRIHVLDSQLGHTRLKELTPRRLEQFFALKLEGGLSAQTVQHLRAILRAALNDAIKDNLVKRNAAGLADGPRVPYRESPTVSPQDARALLDVVRGDRLEGLFVLAIASGSRQGELLGLRWQDVDLDAGTVCVNGALQRVNGRFSRVDPKTSRSRRTLALPDIAVDALRLHRIRQLEERLACGPYWQDSGYVFTAPTGAPLHGPNVTLHFQALLRGAGLPRSRFHDLRHACGSLLVGLGVHPRVIMEVLGHSTIGTTMNIYAHVTPALQREAAEKLNELLAAQ